jgi:hypothetical protein
MRVMGGLLVLLGVPLAVGLGILLRVMAPMLLHPGVQFASSRFTGDRNTGLGILALLCAVFAFGLVATGLGLWRLFSGRFGSLPAALGALLAGTALVFATMYFLFAP